MSQLNDRRESRFFTGDEQELSEIKRKESLEKFASKKRKRKNFARLSYFFVFAVIVVIFVIICLAVFFRIEEIEIVGSSRYTKEEILELVEIEEGLSLYEVSDSDLEILTTKLAYIKDAHVVRKLPHTLVISVTEDSPSYMCELYGEYFVLSDALRVLDRVYDRAELDSSELIEILLPEINSVIVGGDVEFAEKVSQKYVTAYLDALEASHLYSRATAFDLRSRFKLALISDGIYLVNLGNGDELGTKLTAVASMLDNAVFADKVPATIDATDPSQCPVIKNPDLIIEFDD